MTALGLGIIKTIFKESHLPVVKLDVQMFEDEVDGSQVITVRVQGVSQRGNKTYIQFEDFPNTDTGHAQANKLYLEMQAWNGEEKR